MKYKVLAKSTICLAIILLCERIKAEMKWHTILHKRALCNDLTPAGFFADVISNGSKKWLIFLESGGTCYSNTSCISRYFRDSFKDNPLYFGPDGQFNYNKAKTEALALPLSSVVSPLMTSMITFSNSNYFLDNLQITGLGLFSRNCTSNPVFCGYNQILIPYCSSDLWIADSSSTSNCVIPSAFYDACYNNTTHTSCKLIGETFFRECFLVNSTDNAPFIFRGSVIFREAIKQLDLTNAVEVVLAGSSAGGIGAINQAKWLYNYLQNYTDNSSLSVITDSAWFVNFQDIIYRVFNGFNSANDNSGFTNIIQDNDDANVTCNDLSYGSPCCLSAYCMLTNLDYYPYTEVPTLAIFSLYDVYLLAASLKELPGVSHNIIQNSGFLAYLQLINEYGGAVNTSLALVAKRAGKFSYVATECFQHIYFVTSTLWGENKVLGTQTVEINKDIASFRHTMDFDVWKTLKLSGGVTISEALVQWNASRFQDQQFQIRDQCFSPHCNSNCPEQLIIFLEGDNWPSAIKALMICAVLGVTVACLILKLVFYIWLTELLKKQKKFQDTASSYTVVNTSELHEVPEWAHDLHEFPQCTKTISVACKNLSYSVHVKPGRIKDEKTDVTHPVVLSGLGEKEFSLSIRHSLGLEDQQNGIGKTFMLNDNKADVIKKDNICCKAFVRTNKKILKGISAYFDAGELIGIMGPSGCGKTTLLDLLSGRRQPTEGQILVNGTPMNHQQEKWYASHFGYALQLATTYYEKLTVRENLLLTAEIKLSRLFTKIQKFERVEQVMSVTGLLPVADSVVGYATGPGLSGGQKRRLIVAMQLLKLPSVIILDEPTSGLDSSSSFELLTHLNELADTNRTVIITIHQPRLEIFHLFHKLVLLTDGKIAYHGAPEKAYEAFVTALKTRYLERGFTIPEVEDHNPADVIMDLLGNPTVREIITEYYQHSGEQNRILMMLKKAEIDSKNGGLLEFVYKRNTKDDANLFTRLAALEARNAKQGGMWQLLYLPCLFLAYGFLLGTAYWQTKLSSLVLSGFCVYSVASALFMFPALYGFYQKALEVYKYEHADGIGRPWDLVIQGFIKAVFMSIIPVIICAGILYLMLVDSKLYSWKVFGQILIVNMALNQAWIALLIFLIFAFPKLCVRLSPALSSVAGFASGFFIPRDTMPLYYRWICYINPNYYGLFASAKLLLSNYNATCTNQASPLQCFTSSGVYVLREFNMDDTNPYLHITVLISFTLFYLLAAVAINAINHMSNTPWPFSTRQNKRKPSEENQQSGALVIEMRPLENEAPTQGSLTAQRRWKIAGKKYLEQVEKNQNPSLEQIKFRSPFCDVNRTSSLPEELVFGEPSPLKRRPHRTLSKLLERQKRVARQVSTTVEAMKSIEESVVKKLQQPNRSRYSYHDTVTLYRGELTESIENHAKHHRPQRRSTVGDISHLRKVPQVNTQTSTSVAGATETIQWELEKHTLPTVEPCKDETTI